MSGASLADRAEAPAAKARAGSIGLAPPLRVALVGVVMLALAAVARFWALDTYVTIDESRWVQRAADFWALIGQGNREDTFIIGHPGVTTMWTALIGIGPDQSRHFSFLEGRDDATRRDGYFDALMAARRPFALIAAVGVAAVTLLAWRLLGAGPALVAGLLLTFEPFLVAHARVAHLDSGLTVYSAITLLAGLIFWTAGGAWPYLVLSGVAAGLAFLTKAPSVFVVGFVPLAAAVAWATGQDRSLRSLMLRAGQLLVWGGLAFLVAIVLWPAFRVDPVGTLLKMAQFTERVGGGEHDNFFAGVVTDDPGPFFYPLALLLRLAPLSIVGVVLLAILSRRLDRARRWLVLALVAYSVGFMLMMDIGPKKFDRYMLPIFPAIGLLAGLGLWLGLGEAQRRLHWRPIRSVAGLLVAVFVVQGATLASVQPYPLAYYNPLLGGGSMADRLVLVGWGEGLDQVATWLNAQPRVIGEPTIASSYQRVLQAQLTGSALPLERVRMADYVVPYVNTLQRGADDDVLSPYLASGPPEYAVRINGIEYARVYRGPHYPTGATLNADLGGVTLLSYLAAPGSGDLRAGEEVTVQLRWDRAPASELRAAVAVQAADGRVVVQDERPVGADGPNEQGQPGEIHRLTIPARTPAGGYRLVMRVLDPRARSPQPSTPSREPGQDWLPLRALTIGTGP